MKTIKLLGTAVMVLAIFGLFVGAGLFAQDQTGKAQNGKAVQEKVQTQARTNDGTPQGRGMQFIDEDGNGICDRFEQGQAMGPRGHGKGMGKSHRGMRQGRNFIDENGDGVCDNRGSGGMRGKAGHGQGRGRGHRPGSGPRNGQ